MMSPCGCTHTSNNMALLSNEWVPTLKSLHCFVYFMQRRGSNTLEPQAHLTPKQAAVKVAWSAVLSLALRMV